MYLTNDNMVHIESNGIEFLKFRKLVECEEIVHAFSLKPLNFRSREDIDIDYKILLNELGIGYETLVKPTQSHTDNILVFEDKQNLDMADINLDYLKDIDGIITNKSQITLATTSADCLCALLYDREKGVIGNVHSGWRGTFKKILPKAVQKMIQVFGCNPTDILVFFAPAIRKCCFEVDEDVMELCKNIFADMSEKTQFIEIGRILGDKQKYNIDNILINKLLLYELGVLEENIYDSQICSFCNSAKVHSRRADGENFGLGTTVIMKK